MSADLFAQFGPASGSGQTAKGQQAQSSSSNSNSGQQSANDPFAFFSAAYPPAPPAPPPSVFQSPPPLPSLPSSASPPTPRTGLNTWLSLDASLPSSTAANHASWTASTGNGNDDNDDDDDAWGDFEDASAAPSALPPPSGPSKAPTPLHLAPKSANTAAPTALSDQEPIRTRVVRSSTLDLMTNTLIDFHSSAQAKPTLEPVLASPLPPASPLRQPSPPPGRRTAAPLQPRKPADPNVLFDAEDYDGKAVDSDDDDLDDDFGDFETAAPLPRGKPQDDLFAAAPASTATTTATAMVDLLSLSEPDPVPQALQPPQASSRGLSISTQAMSSPTHAQSLSVLSFGSISPQPPKSPSFQERNPFPGLAVTTPRVSEFPREEVQRREPSPVTAWPEFDADLPPAPVVQKAKASTATARAAKASVADSLDDWDAWDMADGVSNGTSQDKGKNGKKDQKDKKVKNQTKKAASDWDWDAEATDSAADSTETSILPPSFMAVTTAASKSTSISDSAPPPSNVPPPAILLSVFPALLALPDEALLQPIAGQPAATRNRILGHPQTIAFLRNFLQLVGVAARIVAGRKQRWHRDKFLAQSMSISAAGSSRGGGMKLAGIDKSHSQREDREAADVVAAWRRHVGKLRSAVSAANSALANIVSLEHKHQEPLRLAPELLQSETVSVRVAKNVPTAPRPCVVCGLRRDERVRGVDDDDVPDSFGEWWIEHWGHRACRNFWVEHEAKLRSR